MEDVVLQLAVHWAAFLFCLCSERTQHSEASCGNSGAGFKSLRLGWQHGIATLAEHAVQAEKKGGNLGRVFLRDALL